MRIGIIAALPAELKPLVRGWQTFTATDGSQTWTREFADGDTWVAACSGMGAEAARRAFVAAEAAAPLDLVLSVGWAGALSAATEPGEASSFSAILDARTGERFQLISRSLGPTLITASRVVDAKEKARFSASYPGATMVDMEAATIARMALMRGIPVACIKGVSDGNKAELPDLNLFTTPKGQLRLLPFLAYLAIRPRYWVAVVELSRNSGKAAQAICNLILEFLEETNGDKLNRAGNP